MTNESQSLLEIEGYHRSERNAREYVRGLAEVCGLTNFGTKLAAGKLVTFQTAPRSTVVDLRKEVKAARDTGVPNILQSLFDQSDGYMAPIIELGASGKNLGIEVCLTTTIGDFTYSVSSPGILESPTTALADDLLLYRAQAVVASAEPNLKKLARNYRTYLQISVSLIDAFLGHATFALAAHHPEIGKSEHFKVIRSTAPLADRINAWFGLCNRSAADYRQTKCWSDLEKIRTERNRYVHPAEPVYSLGLDDITNVLNRCRDGVGGSLACFREAAGLDPRLSYIQKVITAPVITRMR